MSATSSSLIRRTLRIAALLTFAALVSRDAAGQRSIRPPRPVPAPPVQDSVRIYLMTMGQGDQVFELFGHNAIWVQDPSQPTDKVYNWGVFDFQTPGFIRKFLMGDMRYIMDEWTLNYTLRVYQHLNRHVWAQELNLTPSEKRELITFLRWNVLPENRTYRYDYYLDNCSTRVRDAIDRVLKGAVRAHLKSIPTDETYRGHSLRLMQSEKLMVSGVQMALGRPTDRRLTADETSFLPVQLMQHLRSLKLDGGTRPLIGEEFVVYQATRPPEPSNIPKLWKAFLPIGVLLAAALLVLGYAAAPAVGRRRGLATVIAILAGLVGLIGSILTFLVTFTDHVAAHTNENMFLLNPLWLGIAVVGPMLILRGRARQPARWLAIVAAGLAVTAVLIHLVGLSRQPNWDVIGLLLPLELAMAFLVFRHSGTTTGRV